MTPDQIARYHEDLRPELLGATISLSVLANVIVSARCAAQYRVHYSNGWRESLNVIPEDVFMILSTVSQNLKKPGALLNVSQICVNLQLRNIIRGETYNIAIIRCLIL